MSGGTVAGRGEPANRCWGAKGYTDRVNDMPPVTGGKSTNCGSGAWPQQLQRVRMNPFLAHCDERVLFTSRSQPDAIIAASGWLPLR
jgi:hypothetical protein